MIVLGRYHRINGSTNQLTQTTRNYPHKQRKNKAAQWQVNSRLVKERVREEDHVEGEKWPDNIVRESLRLKATPMCRRVYNTYHLLAV